MFLLLAPGRVGPAPAEMAARVLVPQASDGSTNEPVAAYEREFRARFEAHFAASAKAKRLVR
jgi:hypothetical protein